MSAIKLTPEVNIEVKDILSGISKLETPDLEQFLKEVAHILARRKVKSLSKRETELMFIINKSLLSNSSQERFDILYQKLKNETLTDKEHQQLIKLTNQQEAKAVDRLGAMVELSQLRNVTLDDLMEQLGIKPVPTNA